MTNTHCDIDKPQKHCTKQKLDTNDCLWHGPINMKYTEKVNLHRWK